MAGIGPQDGGSATAPIDFERELNPRQREAVQSLDGPHLVIAGAGSGKTRTLVYRVANLVMQGVHPESILLLTFTRRAAQEMLRRATGRTLDPAPYLAYLTGKYGDLYGVAVA